MRKTPPRPPQTTKNAQGSTRQPWANTRPKRARGDNLLHPQRGSWRRPICRRQQPRAANGNRPAAGVWRVDVVHGHAPKAAHRYHRSLVARLAGRPQAAQAHHHLRTKLIRRHGWQHQAQQGAQGADRAGAFLQASPPRRCSCARRTSGDGARLLFATARWRFAWCRSAWPLL